MLEKRLGYQGQQLFLNEKMNDRINAWFIEAAWMAGMAPPMPGYAADPLQYHDIHAHQDPGWTWVGPRNDPQAVKILVEETLDTRSISRPVREMFLTTLSRARSMKKKNCTSSTN